jgi:hypothetical protein
VQQRLRFQFEFLMWVGNCGEVQCSISL